MSCGFYAFKDVIMIMTCLKQAETFYSNNCCLGGYLPSCPSVDPKSACLSVWLAGCLAFNHWTKNNSLLCDLVLLPSQIAYKLNSSARRLPCHCTRTQLASQVKGHPSGGLFANLLVNSHQICSLSLRFTHGRLNWPHPPLHQCN